MKENMAKESSSTSNSGDIRYRCIITRIAPFGMFADIPDLNAEGLLRITELTNPAILQDRTRIGTEILARVLGKETPDGPFILSQH
jgi:predicted RNA-binding protein with RPS1 domain